MCGFKAVKIVVSSHTRIITITKFIKLKALYMLCATNLNDTSKKHIGYTSK